MKKLLLAVFGAVLMSGLGSAEKPVEFAKHNDFVTVIKTLDGAAAKRLKLIPLEVVKRDGDLSRKELIMVLHQAYTHYEPKFRVTPRPFDSYDRVVQENNESEQAKILLKLSKLGLVAPVGPVVVGKNDRLTALEVGDALGFFYSKIAVYSHQPDPLWTPELQDGI